MASQYELTESASRGLSNTSLYLIPLTLLVIFVVTRAKTWWRLREFKGPWLASISSISMAKIATSGRMNEIYTEINKKYGKAFPSFFPSSSPNFSRHQQIDQLADKETGDLARIGSNDLLCSDPEVIRYMSSTRANWHRSDWYDSMSLDPYQDTVITLKNPQMHDKMKAKLISGVSVAMLPTQTTELRILAVRR